MPINPTWIVPNPNEWDVRPLNRFEQGGIIQRPPVTSSNTLNIELLLALAAHSMGLEEEAQRAKFYDRVRRELLITAGAPAEYLYNMLIKIAYEVKYGES